MVGLAFGVGRSVSGRKAGMQAAQEALDRLGTSRPAFAMIFISQEYPVAEVTNGAANILGIVPLWGFSTVAPILGDAEQPGSVVVVIVSSREIKAQGKLFQHIENSDSLDSGEFFRDAFGDISQYVGGLLTADGMHSNIEKVLAGLTDLRIPLLGGLGSADGREQRSYQIGGYECGSGALSALLFAGHIKVGSGSGHGWLRTGVNFTLSKIQDACLHTLDDAPAINAYAKYFGHPHAMWKVPPLSKLIRLYPLGIERFPGSGDLILRAPLRVEDDGSLCMNAHVLEGQKGHLMIGDVTACLAAARQSAEGALRALAPARPFLAVVFVDLAWRYLFEAATGNFLKELHATLTNIPLVGAYTMGQISLSNADTPSGLVNQYIRVVLFGEP